MRRRSSHRAHPRSRGENAPHAVPVEFGHGSSPLTRGKLVEGARLFDVVGLIPAHAGKTSRATRHAVSLSAHPRSRGENAYVTGADNLCSWLIPAHAGKTISEHANSDPAQAHPRSRGENLMPLTNPSISDGSSPLTRGKRGYRDDRGVHPRLIPAHAGKTLASLLSLLSRGAHPRSRGENVPPG